MNDDPKPPAGSKWLLKQTGENFIVIGCGRMEIDYTECVIYSKRLTGQTWWIRPVKEFVGGLFERVADDNKD